MKSFETYKTWLIIIGLLVFGALASVAWPAIVDALDFDANLDFGSFLGGTAGEVEQESDNIPLPDWLAGLPGVEAVVDNGEVHPLLVLAVLGGLLVGLIAGTGLVIGLLFRLLDRQARQVKTDPEFQSSAAGLAKREQERLRAKAESQPPTPMPSHEHPRWSAVATALVVLFFVLLAGFAVADTIYPAGPVELASGWWVDPALPWSLGMVLVAMLLILLFARGRSLVAGGGDNRPISWNVIWVIVTGLIFLGIGIGLTLAMRVAEVPGG